MKEKITLLDLLDLSGSDNADFALVCDALGANPTGIQLKQLCFGCMDRTGCDALIRCLPKLLSLKQLFIQSVVYGVRSEHLLCALRQNGSLQDVTVGPVDRTGEPLFDDRESRLVQSYCKRNEAIPTLVSKVYNEENDRDLCLLPTLFRAAKQVPRTAPNSMLIALLTTACDSLESKSGGKRFRPDHRALDF